MSNVQRFGSYFLLKKIAAGGMAELYKAKKSGEKGFEKLLAIKVILPHLSANEDFISMFIDEAKVAALLDHQNIVQIYDLGKIENTYCIVMEYVRGKDLKAVLSRGSKQKRPMGVEHACAITASALSGLSYAHRKKDKGVDLKIVHRDISPQNILVSYEGEVKIVDFGIAKAATQSRDTRAGVLKGKVSYMSPEQAYGRPLDNRSDIFSIGVVMYEMLTGRKLFQGDTDLNTLERVREAKVAPLPTELNGDVPRELEAILLKALAKEPEARFQTAGEMDETLQGFIRKAGYTTSSYSLSQYMYGLFKDDIEEELREEEGWDHTLVSKPALASAGIGPTWPAAETPRARPAKPAAAPASRTVRPAPRAERKRGMPLRDKVLIALIVVVALAIAGMWWRSRPGAQTKEQTQPRNAKTTVAETSAGAVTAQTPAVNPVPPENSIPASAQRTPQKPTPSPQPAPQSPATVSASISSEPPGAEVYIDGEASGITPAKVEGIEPGRDHTVRLVKEGFEPWSKTFYTAPGKNGDLHATLKEATSTITVESTPAGARVIVDGRDTGMTTPANLLGLKPGRPYKVRVELDGFSTYETTVVAEGSRPAEVKATLTQQYGTLTVDARPWAVVIIDGEEKGMTPLAGIRLTAGEHNLVLGNLKLKIGKRMKVSIEPDKTTRVVIDLMREGKEFKR